MYFLHNKIKGETINTWHLNISPSKLGEIIKVQQFYIAELLLFILSYST